MKAVYVDPAPRCTQCGVELALIEGDLPVARPGGLLCSDCMCDCGMEANGGGGLCDDCRHIDTVTARYRTARALLDEATWANPAALKDRWRSLRAAEAALRAAVDADAFRAITGNRQIAYDRNGNPTLMSVPNR